MEDNNYVYPTEEQTNTAQAAEPTPTAEQPKPKGNGALIIIIVLLLLVICGGVCWYLGSQSGKTDKNTTTTKKEETPISESTTVTSDNATKVSTTTKYVAEGGTKAYEVYESEEPKVVKDSRVDDIGLVTYGDKDYEIEINCDEDYYEKVKSIKIHNHDVTKKANPSDYLTNVYKYEYFMVIAWENDATCGSGFHYIDVFNYDGELLFTTSSEFDEDGIGLTTEDSDDGSSYYMQYSDFAYDSKTNVFGVEYYANVTVGCDDNISIYDEDAADYFDKAYCETIRDNKIERNYIIKFDHKSGKFTNRRKDEIHYFHEDEDIRAFCKNNYNVTIKK